MLLNAVVKKNIVDFIKGHNLILFIESMDSKAVELLLVMAYEEINEFQNLLTDDYLENHGIFGEVNCGYFNANINKIIEWINLSVEDFESQIDKDDWQRYQKWLKRPSTISA